MKNPCFTNTSKLASNKLINVSLTSWTNPISVWDDVYKILKTHYSKSQMFGQIFNFDKTPTFSRVFHPKFFWQFFSWNQSCQELKSPKPQHFHEFFTHKKIHNFLGKSKLIFWTKNQDFEQCVFQSYSSLFQILMIGLLVVTKRIL